ncbi:hypothetical protein DL96DRAFT_1601260 [Flagelloscypha sp. PMI_526]|nr:hypothetical protein DL96DRAFT_1601260 [Flagelloscypha sp. PMI_526]
MRYHALLTLALLSFVSASWFYTDSPPEYSKWSSKEMKTWLDAHSIDIPNKASTDDLRSLVESNWNSASVWTHDQYNSAQEAFNNVKASTFDSWDESRLREFLLEQGIVAPKGPREHLVLLAKSKYRAQASQTASSVSKDSQATASQASATISTFISQSTDEVNRKMDDAKDYIYSSWSDNELRTWLEEKGIIKTGTQKKRDEYLALMQENYAKVANPLWSSWSESYVHDWLVDHGVIKSEEQKTWDGLKYRMNLYYYNTKDTVYDTWDESTLRQWLVTHGIIKSDAQMSKEKLQRLVSDNYANARDTVWSSWSDSDIRQWLIANGYMKSDAQKTRDELVTMINDKTAAYLTWPDARLRAYLREHGFSEAALPSSRPGLLQETRIRWVQTQNRSEHVYNKLVEVINNSVQTVEDKLKQVYDIVSGSTQDAKSKVEL